MSKGRMLIVGNESPDILDVKRKLRDLGYRVLAIVCSAQEAVEEAERARPDVALIDVACTTPTRWVELADTIASRHDVPVIYLTGESVDEAMPRQHTVGSLGHIRKSCSERELQLVVESALDRARMEKQLSESEETYRNVIERASDGIVILQDREFKYVNPRLAEILGCSVDELIGSPVVEYVHPQDRAKVLTRYEQRMRGDEVAPVYEVRLQRADGSEVSAELNAGLTTYHGRPADLAIVRDISDHRRLQEEVRKRRLYLEAVLQAAPDAIVTLDTERRVSEWNRGAEILFGYSSDEAVGRDLDELIAMPGDEVVDEAASLTQRVLGGETVRRAECTRYRKDGTPVDVILAAAPIFIGEEFVGAVTVYTEITERKQVEGALRRRTRQLEAVRDVGLDIIGQLNLDELLRSIVARAIELVDATAGGFDLYRPARDVLEFSIHIGYDGLPAQNTLTRGEGLAGKVWETGQTIIVDDYAAWEGKSAVWADHVGHCADIGVPVQWGDQFLGVLEVTADSPRKFSQGDAQLLELFAAQAAIAMRNARMYEQAERRASQLRAINRVAHRASLALHLDDLIEAIYEEIDTLFEADAFFLALYDREEGELDFRLSVDEGTRESPPRQPLEAGLTASVVTEGRPLLIRDYEQEREDLPPAQTWGTQKVSRSWLGVPMRVGEQVVGVISVQAYDLFAYGEDDQRLLSTIADQAAIALEKTRLYEESQRRARQTALLSEAGRHVSSELEPDALLDTIVSAVRDSFDYHNVILLLLEPGHGRPSGDIRLQMQSIAGNYTGILPDDLSIAIGEGMTGQAAATGETQLSNDVRTDPHYVRKAAEDTKSELVIPIKSGDRVIGVLDLQEDEYDAFDELDVTTLETLATQIAAAIENARLFQAERERSAQLAMVSKVAESITSILDPDEVMEKTVQMITEAFGYYYASIMLLDDERGDLVFKAGAGGFSGKTPSDYRQGIKEGMIGWVAHHGESLLADDVSQDPRYIPAYLTGTKSELDVPLKYRDEVIGVLNLQSEELSAFSEHDVMAMEALAGHIAAAIENARLFGVARQRVAELWAVREASLQLTSTLELEPVLETILEGALDLVSADNAHIFLYDDGTLSFGAAMWSGERQNEPIDTIRPDGLTYNVARSGERIVVTDAMSHEIFEDRRWDGAIVGLPLTIGDAVQGVMNIAYEQPHKFTDEELWVLNLLADQAAIAIRNARLYDEARDRALEQETLRETALALTTALDRDEVVERVLAQLQRVVPYDTASVLLLRGERVQVVGGRGYRDLSSIKGLSFPLDEEHPNRAVIHSGEPVILEDAPEAYEAFQREPHAGTGIRSWLGVRMAAGDRTIGMIALDKRVPGFYTDEHARLAQAFAAQAAVAFENARLYEAEQEQRELSERLRETALLLNRSLDLQEVLEMILEQLASVIDYDSGSIQILEDEATKVIAVRNLEESEVGEAYALEDYAYNQCLVEEARPIVIDDVRDDAQGWRMAEGLEHVRANIGVPLQTREQVIGILTVDSREPAAYSEDDARLVQTFAQQAALAIENAQLFERERKQRRVSEALEEAAAAVVSTLELETVLDRILEQVARVVDGDAFNVMLVEGDQAEICRWRGYEQFGAKAYVSTASFDMAEVPNLRQMSRSGEPLVIEDVRAWDEWVEGPGQRWLRSYMGAPIKLGGAIVGYLNADSADPGRFGAEDARRLAAFADHAATAIDNARLYTEAQERALEQETLREAALAMRTALERDEVVERILAHLQEVVPYDTASVQLLRGDRLEIVGGRGFPNLEELLGVSFDLERGDNPNRLVVRTREPMILQEARAEYEAFQQEPHAQADIRSWLGVPMLVGDRLIGMISLDRRDPSFYSEEHARLAEAFAAQAAIAIENARLHQDTVRRLAETEVLREVMLAAASTLDFDEVLARTIEVLERAMGIEYLGFVVPDAEESSGETFMVSHPCMLGYDPPDGRYRFHVDDCVTGHVYKTGESMMVSDVREAASYAAAAPDVRSELAVPVKVSRQVAAVLNVESTHPDALVVSTCLDIWRGLLPCLYA